MSPRPLRVPLLLALVWLAGAAVATGVGVLAVGLVAEQVGDQVVAPLTSEAVEAAAPTLSPGPPAPSTSAAASGIPATSSPAARPTARPTSAPGTTPAARPPAPPRTRAFRSSGGSVGVECSGTTARLLYATPADGYALDERSVSGSSAEVRFEGAGTRVRLELSCASGTPVLVDERTDERSGGSGGSGSGSDAGSGSGGDPDDEPGR